MNKVLIRYTLRAGEVQENTMLLKRYFDELETLRPAGLTYEALLLQDGQTFVHLVESPSGPAPFGHLRSYRDYRDTVDARCISRPEMVSVRTVGSYRNPAG